jgi:maltose alpha-D-glucosyltransferase / alpha-amylase
MRIFGRGIRRRIAPMLNDPRRVLMAYSLMMSLPGSPLLMYGDEIGMGEDLSLPGRDAVRTPMQWSNQDNGGFSSAPRDALVGRMISDGPFRYEAVNAEDQMRDPESLLSRMKALIRLRRQCPEWGWGVCSVVDMGEAGVSGHRTEWQGRSLVALHNLTDKSCSVRVPLEPEIILAPVWSSGRDDADRPPARVELEPYGYRWYCLVSR